MSSVYAGALRASLRLHEEVPVFSPAGEMEMQAGFYRGDFGDVWKGTEGETVEVLHPGRWNREPGPDFCNARLRIDGTELSGDVEIDMQARDWEAHGHSGNPAYGNVRLHVFFRTGARRFFTRDHEHRLVPQVLLPARPARRKPAADEGSSQKLDAKDAERLVCEAARYRLHRKREGFARAARLVGADDALFQGLATGLGYKNNKLPFLLVAQRLGWARARSGEGEALLFGLAGFLRAVDFDRGDEEERRYLGGLWRQWWPLRDAEARLILPETAWKFAAIRPANHPHRRMGALAAIVSVFPRLRQSIATADCAAFTRALSSIEHPYWQARWNLSSARLSRSTALLGRDRAREIAINVLAAALPDDAAAWRALETADAAAPNRRVADAAEWLCGGAGLDLATAVHQQGLLQLYEDFFPQNPSEIWAACRRGSTE